MSWGAAEDLNARALRVPRPAHPTVERYLLVTVELPGGNIEVGLHRHHGEPVRWLRAELRRIVEDEILILNGESVTDDTATRIVDGIEARVQETWPGRPWWAEVYDTVERLTQSYAPYGMPRHQATPTPTGG